MDGVTYREQGAAKRPTNRIKEPACGGSQSEEILALVSKADTYFTIGVHGSQ